MARRRLTKWQPDEHLEQYPLIDLVPQLRIRSDPKPLLGKHRLEQHQQQIGSIAYRRSPHRVTLHQGILNRLPGNMPINLFEKPLGLLTTQYPAQLLVQKTQVPIIFLKAHASALASASDTGRIPYNASIINMICNHATDLQHPLTMHCAKVSKYHSFGEEW